MNTLAFDAGLTPKSDFQKTSEVLLQLFASPAARPWRISGSPRYDNGPANQLMTSHTTFRRLAAKAFTNLPKSDRDRFILHQFITSLRDSTASGVLLLHPPASLSSAIQQFGSTKSVTRERLDPHAAPTAPPARPPHSTDDLPLYQCDSRTTIPVPYCAAFGPQARRCGHNQPTAFLSMGVTDSFSPQKNGSLRLCIDYRRLNSVTVRDSFPLPRLDDTLDSLGGAAWFSTLDLKSGYRQVEIDPKDRPKTAFIVSQGLFEFQTLPFGPCNAAATFQRLMYQELRHLVPHKCLVYQSDIIVFRPDVEQHNRNLREVLEALRDAGLTLNPAKCTLLRPEVQFLGHKISPGRIAALPGRLQQIRT
nr:unnamed protein product [Spirometra erinaceieuropaei]